MLTSREIEALRYFAEKYDRHNQPFTTGAHVILELIGSRKMTTTEAAAILGVTRAWLWRLIKRGTIKAERRGRDWWIEQAEVDRYNAERKPAHRPVKK